MAGMRLKADRGVCMGAGACIGWAPEVFGHDAEGLVVLFRNAPESEREAESVRAAVASCPSGALEIVDCPATAAS